MTRARIATWATALALTLTVGAVAGHESLPPTDAPVVITSEAPAM